jgi:hypothetical protein
MGGRRSNDAAEGGIVKPGYRDGRVRDSTMAHRYRFLWAVQEHVPEVLADLNRDVLPLFRGLYREGNLREIGEVGCVAFNTSGEQIAMLCIKWSSMAEANKRGELWFHPTWKGDFLDVPLNGDRLKFKNAMENWAAKYHLSAEPILEDAFSTLLFWIANPNGDHRHWLPHGHDRSPEEIANAPKFHLDDVWAFEPWPAVKKRLDEQIAGYKSAVQKYCAAIGFDVHRMRQSFEHHEWLALFHCKQMSAARIQKWNLKQNHREVDPSAISHAVTTMAKRVGLEIRGRRSHTL